MKNPTTTLFITEHDAIKHGVALWPVQVSCVPLPTSHLPPGQGQSERKRQP